MPLSSVTIYVNRARTLPRRAALHGASPHPEQAPIDGADPLKGELELAKGLEQCIVAVRNPNPSPSPIPNLTLTLTLTLTLIPTLALALTLTWSNA